jgi:uncharacterized phage protein (TIGR01671 family)
MGTNIQPKPGDVAKSVEESFMRDYDARFRFRVWHKEFKRFLTGEEWFLDMDGKLRFAEYPQGNGDNAADSVFEPVKNPEAFVIETCTGAVDKNQKLIYEGDILKVKRSWTRPKVVEKTYRGVVKHELDYEFHEGDEEVGYVCWLPFQYGYNISYEHLRYDDYDDFHGIDHRYEIIGNVHENQELVNYGV